MFASSVKSTSKKAIFDKENNHMNGPILGAKDGVYLVKFMCDLCRKYRETCGERGIDHSQFHKDEYIDTLTRVLRLYEDDEKKYFGRYEWSY